METIIASLIIACSNLVQPTSTGRVMLSDAINTKKSCIDRVNTCFQNYYKVTTLPTYIELLKTCSDKVY